MRQTMDYSNLTGQEKQRAALNHLVFYLGGCLYRKIIKTVKTNPITKDYLRMYFSMLGVDGYPVTAFIERYNNHYFTLKG